MYTPEFITLKVIQLLRAMRGSQAETEPLQVFLNVSEITELSLRDHALTTDEIINLCRALQVNKTLISLDLGLCRLDYAAAFYLERLLEANTPLMSLNLERNPLCVAGANLLAQGLKRNNRLQILNLRQTQICSAGAEHLAAALIINKTLRSLDLGLNGISKRTGEYFAKALKVNISLLSLNLEDNQLGCDGIKPLVEACIHNQVLAVLYLGANQIKDKGADALLEVVNFMLKQSILRSFVVNVAQNCISDEKLFLLQSALAAHKAAHKAYIDNIKSVVQLHLPVNIASLTVDYLGTESYSMNEEGHCQRGLKRKIF